MSAKSERRRQFFKSIEAKSLRSRSFLTQIADKLTNFLGSTGTLVMHVIIFTAWLMANTGNIPGVAIFDPYPFGFLTLVVSLEAIFLSLFILVSQNRSSYINTIREEVHLQVNLIAEEEVTKILSVLAEMRTKMGIKEADPELDKMLERTDANYIEQSVVAQLARAEKPIINSMIHEFPEFFKEPIERIKKLTNHDS